MRTRIHFLNTAASALLALTLFLLSLNLAAAPQQQPVSTLPDNLTLPLALALTLEHNHDILLTRQAIEAQSGLRLSARARYIPRLDFVADYSKTDSKLIEGFGQGAVPDDDDWGAAFQLTYDLYTGGADTARAEASRARLEAARDSLTAAINDALLAVITAYENVLLAQDVIGVRQEAVTIFEEQLQDAQNRFEAGSVTEFEVLRARVALANARPPLIRAASDYTLAVDALRRVIGLPYAPDSKPQTITLAPTRTQLAPEWTLREAISHALENRYDLAALQDRANAAASDKRLARAGYYPQIEALASYGWQHRSFAGDFNDNLEGWQAGLSLSVPIFDFGRTRGDVMAAQAGLREAELSRDQLALEIEGQVRTAHADFEEATKILDTAELVVDQAREALRLAENRYGAGRGTQLDVQQSQLDLTTAQLEHARARHQLQLAIAALQRATGTLAQERKAMPHPLTTSEDTQP